MLSFSLHGQTIIRDRMGYRGKTHGVTARPRRSKTNKLRVINKLSFESSRSASWNCSDSGAGSPTSEEASDASPSASKYITLVVGGSVPYTHLTLPTNREV